VPLGLVIVDDEVLQAEDPLRRRRFCLQLCLELLSVNVVLEGRQPSLPPRG
jgi:hypothetical protein